MSNITRLNYAEKILFWIFWFGGSAAISLFDFYLPIITGTETWVAIVNISLNMAGFWIFCWFLSRFIFTIGGRFKS